MKLPNSPQGIMIASICQFHFMIKNIKIAIFASTKRTYDATQNVECAAAFLLVNLKLIIDAAIADSFTAAIPIAGFSLIEWQRQHT